MEWVKRNIVDKERLDELTELYEELGFEVKRWRLLKELNQWGKNVESAIVRENIM